MLLPEEGWSWEAIEHIKITSLPSRQVFRKSCHCDQKAMKRGNLINVGASEAWEAGFFNIYYAECCKTS